jgi:hypothetical protein
MLIVCEGSVTEPSYLTSLLKLQRVALVDVELVHSGGVPKTIVERAVALKRAAETAARKAHDVNLRYDRVWGLFDIDSHPNVPDAKQQARDNDIELAISNPCFELWAYLHFADRTAYIERHELRKKCKEFMPRYDKTLPFERLRPNYDDAVRRATALDKTHAHNGDPGANPSTRVYVLTEDIRRLGMPAHPRNRVSTDL